MSNAGLRLVLSEYNLDRLILQTDQFGEQTSALQELLPDPAGFQRPSGFVGSADPWLCVSGASGDGAGPWRHWGPLTLPGECSVLISCVNLSVAPKIRLPLSHTDSHSESIWVPDWRAAALRLRRPGPVVLPPAHLRTLLLQVGDVSLLTRFYLWYFLFLSLTILPKRPFLFLYIFFFYVG